MREPAVESLLRSATARFPERPLVRDASGGWTQVEALRLVEDLARGLATRGFEPGDRLFLIRNASRWSPLLAMAVLRLGGVFSGFMLPTPEATEQALRRLGPRWIAGGTRQQADALGVQAPPGARWIGLDEPDELFVQDLALGTRRASLPEEPEPEALAAVFFTSGTTGPPKGALVSRRALLTPVYRDTSSALGSVYLLDRPFNNRTSARLFLDCWLNGNCYGVFDLAEGIDANARRLGAGTLVLTPSYYARKRDEILAGSVGKLGAAAGRRVCRHLGDRRRGIHPPAATAARAWVDLALRRRFTRGHLPAGVELFLSNSAPLPRELCEFFLGLGVPILDVYGLTECGPVAGTFGSAWRPGTVGKPFDRVVVRLSAEGEVLVRGPFVMDGYLDDPARTAAATVDGWTRTGDAGRWDEDGFLVLEGRRADLVIHSTGLKVDPAPLQAALETDPAVARAWVFGDGREALVALVVLREGQVAGEGLDQRLEGLLRGRAPHERVRAFGVLPGPVPEGLTRREAAERFREEVDRLHAGVPAPSGRFGQGPAGP